MKKAIYLRKSRGVIEDLEKHKIQLLKICNDNNWDYDLYQEIASSEKFEERKELTSLLDNIVRYDGVICIHMDRLSRNELHQALITQMFREHNVKVITLNKTYDFNKENDILLGDFEKLIARQELRLTKSRLRRGKLSAFEKGLWVNGFPPIPYVYNKEAKSLDVDEIKLLEFNRIKDLALKGYSCNLIAERVGSNQTRIRRILKSKVGLGYTKYKGEYRKGNHQPVITEDEYNKINNYIIGRIRGIRKAKHYYPFSGIVKCICGYRRTAATFKQKEAIIKCRYCGNRGTLAGHFHEDIRRELEMYIKQIEADFNNSEIENQKKILEVELQYVDLDLEKELKKEKNIKKMMINDLIDFEEGSKNLVKVKKQRELLEERKKLIVADITKFSVDKKEELITLKEVEAVLRNKLEDSEINMLYKTIIDSITIDHKNIVKIIWK